MKTLRLPYVHGGCFCTKAHEKRYEEILHSGGFLNSKAHGKTGHNYALVTGTSLKYSKIRESSFIHYIITCFGIDPPDYHWLSKDDLMLHFG